MSRKNRFLELYRSGGLRNITRGVWDWVLTTELSKRIRAQATRFGGESVWERDWDVLCILDACRVDLFQEVVGECSVMTSVGSTSRTWINRTFNNRNVDSVAYISGNPFADQLEPDSFGYLHIERSRSTDYGVETIPPRALSDRAIDVWRRRDELGVDKLIIHFMQPHAPFRSQPEWFERARGTSSLSGNIWERLREGEFTYDEVWEAYADNLEWAMTDGIAPLTQNCEATIALSADHANAIGEWAVYGHPLGCPISALRDVPWKVIDGVDKQTVDPTISDETAEIDVEEQLAALGYM
ncbi:hypothetical protein Htur_5012 (plasmid) [Haloterrigena turkmenica DSM 5511]|uniref:Sulfatase N-terminal domain-containing protein n=1 Tax=Haloterrigena turkmenica (strain ATCC 51198 / DSM 5511 / JCM 9101 / NCIMB 13204 / VKM B-1734 / 4k) TaxID=543526 RepID=D2S3F3_HALTV|nr:hypothetical protein [Haloterrigena turkmenica]ADB63900.1 hypothetical protein Htur_5012 [Haloterrigena turkmenica DSM 5511]